jgi:uncharacterized membrane protein YqaE (UPF0057 family)
MIAVRTMALQGTHAMLVLKIILGIFLPPVAAFLEVGFGLHFWLNLLLTLFFWIPGQIHALWLIVSKSGGNS